MSNRLLSAFAVEDPERFAQMLGAVGDSAEAVSILQSIPQGCEAEVLARCQPEVVERLLADVPETLLSSWLSTCPGEVGRRLLLKLGQERSDQLIERIADPARRRSLKRMASWPAGTIGARMRQGLLAISESTTAEEVEALFREQRGSQPGPAFVVDTQDRVLGLLDLTALVANSDKNALAAEFIIPVRAVHAESPLDSLVDKEIWQGRNTLPVVDFQGRMVGFIGRAEFSETRGSASPASIFMESAAEFSSRYMKFLEYTLAWVFIRRVDR